MEPTTPRRVAVACQGGGSHTAFTAGALAGLLERLDDGGLALDGEDHTYELAALTGTSGGAVCALAAWYGLRTDSGREAVRLLNRVWEDISARSLDDLLTNEAALAVSRSHEAGLPVPQVSPYHTPFGNAARDRIRSVLTDAMDEREIERLVRDPEADDPRILVGAVNVTDGAFETFSDRFYTTASTPPADSLAAEFGERIARRPRPLTVDAVLASAAVPSLFRAVGMRHHRQRAVYWDGLFSQNPPVRDLFAVDDPEDGEGRAGTDGTEGAKSAKPDEVWLVRINPEHRESEPTRLPDIADRRNELSGNLSLQQELHFVSLVNRWLRDGTFSAAATARYKPVTVREIRLERDLLASSKGNRRRSFIDGLRRDGREAARAFLDDPAARRTIVDPDVPKRAVPA